MNNKNKRNIAVLGCETKYEIWLVVKVLLDGWYGTEECIKLDENSLFPKNAVFDDGHESYYYFNWNAKLDIEAYEKCGKITYQEFRELFAEEIKEIEDGKTI